MVNKILIWAVLLGACSKSSYAATRRQAVFGSSASPAGNPNRPQFTLSQTQTAQLPPMDPDIYQDTLLPTVCINSFIYRFIFFFSKQKKISNFIFRKKNKCFEKKS